MTRWLRPLGFVSGAPAAAMVRAGEAGWLAGGPFAFTHVQECAVGRRGAIVPVAAMAEEAATCFGDDRGELPVGAGLARPASPQAGSPPGSRAGQALPLQIQLETLTTRRPSWAGFSLDRPLVMGVLNVTPDSFSDGGDFADAASAVARGKVLLDAGADIVDIGGESTRPGAAPVDSGEEIRRVEPVVRALADAGAVVSVDTRRAAVMAAALAAGASIVNDVTALTGDPESVAVVAGSRAALVLMHMQGEPQTMQREPRYQDVLVEVADYLEERVAACVRAGIDRARIAVDPGIGFGKTVPHNLALLAGIGLLHGIGCPILLGVSRKRFVATLSAGEPAKARVPGSVAAALAGVGQGVQILRVHDVAETRQALAVAGAVAAAKG